MERQLQLQKDRNSDWAAHFEELLGTILQPNPENIQPAESDLPIVCDLPLKEEIHKAFKQLRNGKAAEPDNIPAEALKADVETSVEMLYPLFCDIWEKEDTPPEWKEAYLIKLPKKGKLSSCSNCSRITLL